MTFKITGMSSGNETEHLGLLESPCGPIALKPVAQDQGAHKVLTVRLKVGPLSHISEEHLRDHFALPARGTVAHGARLIMETMNGEIGPEAQSLVLDSLEVAG